MREIKLTVEEAKRLITNNFNGHTDFKYDLNTENNALLIYDYTEGRDKVRNNVLLVKFKTREMIELIDHKTDLQFKQLNESDVTQEAKLIEFVSKVII